MTVKKPVLAVVAGCFDFTGALAFNDGYFGKGTGGGQIGDVLCEGTEGNLLQCIHSSTSCSHTLDVGVRCPGKLSCDNDNAMIT